MGEPAENEIGGMEDLSTMPIPPLNPESAMATIQTALADGQCIAIPALLLMLRDSYRPEIVASLTRIALAHNYDEELLTWAISEAAETCELKETALREDTIYMGIVSEYFNVRGKPFLKAILQPIMEKHSHEVYDITRTPALDATSKKRFASREEISRVRRNKARIREMITDILDAFMENKDEFAKKIGPCIAIAHRKFTEVHSDPDLAYRACATFFFLRFVSKLMSSPFEWSSLQSERVKRVTKTSRQTPYSTALVKNLSIASKALLKIALLVDPPFEEWDSLSVLNTYFVEQRAVANELMRYLWKTPSQAPPVAAAAQFSVERDFALMLEYISKSRPGRFEHIGFRKTMRLLVYKRNYRGKTSVMQNVGMSYVLITSLFAERELLRTFLDKQKKKAGSRKARLFKAISKNARFAALDVPHLKKEKFEGKEYFEFDTLSIFNALRKDAKFFILVVFRGRWCEVCETYMPLWNKTYERIRAEGGVLLATCSQNQNFCDVTREKFQLKFPIIGDPENHFAAEYAININRQEFKDKGYYPYGMMQPAVIARDSDDKVLYYWRSEPTKENYLGATDRPDPSVVVHDVMRQIFTLERSDSVYSLDTSYDSAEESENWLQLEESDEDEESASALDDLSAPDLIEHVIARLRENAEFREALLQEFVKSKRLRRQYHKARKSLKDN